MKAKISPAKPNSDLISVKQMQEEFGVCKFTVYKHIKDGTLPKPYRVVHNGKKSTVFHRSEIRDFEERFSDRVHKTPLVISLNISTKIRASLLSRFPEYTEILVSGGDGIDRMSALRPEILLIGVCSSRRSESNLLIRACKDHLADPPVIVGVVEGELDDEGLNHLDEISQYFDDLFYRPPSEFIIPEMIRSKHFE